MTFLFLYIQGSERTHDYNIFFCEKEYILYTPLESYSWASSLFDFLLVFLFSFFLFFFFLLLFFYFNLIFYWFWFNFFFCFLHPLLFYLLTMLRRMCKENTDTHLCLLLTNCVSFHTFICYSQGRIEGGVQGVQPPPPPEIFRFFLKSEGKEIERKRKKEMLRGGGLPLNIFLGWIFISSGVKIFLNGLRNFREGLRNFRGGLRNLSVGWEIFGGVEKFSGGWEFFGGLRNFWRAVEKFSGGLRNFRGKGEKCSGGGLKFFFLGGGLRNFLGGRLRIFFGGGD